MCSCLSGVVSRLEQTNMASGMWCSVTDLTNMYFSIPVQKGRAETVCTHIELATIHTYGLASGLCFLIFHHINIVWRGLGRLCAHSRGHHTDPLQWQYYIDKARWPQDAGMLKALISFWHGAFTNGDQPVTWGQNVVHTEPLPSRGCQELMVIETNMYGWNGLVFYAGKSSLNITTWGLTGGLISPGVGTAGQETQEMWEGGQNRGTHCSSSSPHLEADGLVEHSQGPARQHSRHPRGAKTAVVPKGKQFCRVVQAPSSSSVHQAESDFTWDHILAWLFPFPSFFLSLETWEILVPQPGTEPMLPAVEAWSLNHWTAREAPLSLCLSCFLPSLKSFSCRNAFPSTNYGALNSFSWLCSFRTQHKTTSPLPPENALERGSIRKWKRACSGD